MVVMVVRTVYQFTCGVLNFNLKGAGYVIDQKTSRLCNLPGGKNL